MYKIMYPYNKFVRKKNCVFIILKLCSNLKNDGFTYLKWKNRNKIIVVTEKIEGGWVVLR